MEEYDFNPKTDKLFVILLTGILVAAFLLAVFGY